MSNYKISRLSCIVLCLLLGVLPSDRLFGAEDEVAPSSASSPSSESSQSSPDDTATTQSLGIGKFASLPFHVTASVRGGYDDNVNTATVDPQGSTFVNVNVALSYAFGSPRTSISLQTNGGITDYFDQPGGINYDFNPNVNFSITYKATPRLTLALTTYAAYQNQPDFADSAGLNRRTGAFFYTTNKFSASFRWRPRFTTVTSYTLNTVYYADPAQGDFENRFENTFGNEFRFLVWPTTTLVAEYRLGVITYVTDTLRDSLSNFFLAGFDHSFSPRFNVTTRMGLEFRSYTNLDNNKMDPYFEGTLTYALGPRSSLSLNSRYSIEEPDIIGSQSRTTFRSGLTGSYNITARISASVAAYYEHDVNDASVSFFFVSPAFTEDSLSLSISLHYAINHTWGAELGYDFTDVESDLPLNSYDRNRLYGGVNFTF